VQLLLDHDCPLGAIGFCTTSFGNKRVGDFTGEEHDCITKFVTAKNLWGGYGAHLVAMTGSLLNFYFHDFRVIMRRRRNIVRVTR